MGLVGFEGARERPGVRLNALGGDAIVDCGRRERSEISHYCSYIGGTLNKGDWKSRPFSRSTS